MARTTTLAAAAIAAAGLLASAAPAPLRSFLAPWCRVASLAPAQDAQAPSPTPLPASTPVPAPTPPPQQPASTDPVLQLARLALKEATNAATATATAPAASENGSTATPALALRLGATDFPSTAPVRLDGHPLRAADSPGAFASFLRAAQPDAPLSTETLALFRTSVAMRELVAERARAAGFDRDEEFRQLLERRVAELLAQEYLRRSVLGEVTVSPAEAEAYYESHPEEFVRPRLATLRVIVAASDEEARDALARLAQGEPFELVAEDLSIHGSRSRGGLLRPRARGSLDARVEEVAWGLERGQVAEQPVAVDGLRYIVKLEDMEPARVVPLEEARPAIMERLYEQRRRERLSEFARALLEGRELILFDAPPPAQSAPATEPALAGDAAVAP